MELYGYLRAHAFMQVERPPELWEADTDDEPFLHMLGEMIVIGLGRGNELADLALAASNVTVEDDEDGVEDDAWPPPGDYVAVTVRGAGNWEADDVWREGQGPTRGLLASVGPAADAAGAVWAYTRNLGEHGAVTAFLPRLEPDG
ncbi:MAG: hypothetical protein ACXWX9_07075 [Actinomycetota bacterium]